MSSIMFGSHGGTEIYENDLKLNSGTCTLITSELLHPEVYTEEQRRNFVPSIKEGTVCRFRVKVVDPELTTSALGT